MDTALPLHKIKQIQSNIKALKTQIKILGRDQVRNIKSIQKCFDQCVPLIKSKLQQSKKHFKIKRLYQQTLQQKQNRILNIKLKKYDDLRKKTNVKALIFSIKHKQANEIRDQSIKNNQSVKQHKTRILQQNARKSQKVKTQHSIIKTKLKTFHQEKIQDLSKIKFNELNQNKLRLTKSNNFMKNIEQKKNSTHQKFVQTHNSLQNLRHIMKRIKFMRPQQFSDLINQTMNSSFDMKQEEIGFRKNSKVLTQMNEEKQNKFPIFGGNCSTEQQFITSHIINNLLSKNKQEKNNQTVFQNEENQFQEQK